uniref:Uncharacterized protein n=1 Tax=Kalanchoe fedtschenkoi TaxID=63787 RepID=A0A7N0TM42_KALFE
MELFARAANILTNIATSNAAINVFLFGAFGALSIRSLVQQREIDALEVEKELLALSNKEMKKTLWDWKQQLYADASNVESAVVPLAKLKAIYGDYTTPSTSNPSKEDVKVSSPKFVI